EIYPEGTVSGFYGPKTTAAVKKFQTKYGLNPVGRVGPATMAKLNEVLSGSVEKVTPSVSVPVTTTPSESTSNTTTQIEDQIKAIQAQIDALLKQ
ncbi:MAG: peptidoglycan-binding domain-containing protein, partial [bacterium]|nr:peptidoglycan-binding domain-containing protein [bacterium]